LPPPRLRVFKCASLAELSDLGIAFVSLMEALEFTTSAGRARWSDCLLSSVESERDMICERVKAGIAQASFRGQTAWAAIDRQ
jgi:DNA invertase Pin-like site-specific DNA recombinase